MPDNRNDSTPAIIQQYYDRFNAADFKGMADLLHDDVVHEINQGQAVRGKANFLAFLDHMNACYRELLHDLVLFSHPDGKHAAAEYIVSGTYLKTDGDLPPARGQEYALRGGAFFELRDSKIARVTNYYNLQEWLDKIR